MQEAFLVFMEELEDTFAIGNPSPDWAVKRAMPAFYVLFDTYVDYVFDSAEQPKAFVNHAFEEEEDPNELGIRS